MLTMKVEPIRGTTKRKAISMIDEFDNTYDRWTVQSSLVSHPDRLREHDLYKYRIDAAVKKYEKHTEGLMMNLWERSR